MTESLELQPNLAIELLVSVRSGQYLELTLPALGSVSLSLTLT